MGRSSRFLCFLLMFVAVPTVGEARGLALHVGATFGTRSFIGVPRVPLRPGVLPRAGFRPGFGRGGRFARGLGYGGFDAAGGALSMATDTLPLLPPDDGYGPESQPIPALLPPRPRPCIRPLIISIGNGLRRPAKTRIVYGSTPPCGAHGY